MGKSQYAVAVEKPQWDLCHEHRGIHNAWRIESQNFRHNKCHGDYKRESLSNRKQHNAARYRVPCTFRGTPSTFRVLVANTHNALRNNRNDTLRYSVVPRKLGSIAQIARIAQALTLFPAIASSVPVLNVSQCGAPSTMFIASSSSCSKA